MTIEFRKCELSYVFAYGLPLSHADLPQMRSLSMAKTQLVSSRADRLQFGLLMKLMERLSFNPAQWSPILSPPPRKPSRQVQEDLGYR